MFIVNNGVFMNITYSTTANLYTHLESNTKSISANILSEAISF